ncbi:IS3 family transposase [Streptomyces canus]|uniref:IS3 family transposase n=1 Tax=Streptomyces canus TaxID=58343 RepID=UPI0035944602
MRHPWAPSGTRTITPSRRTSGCSSKNEGLRGRTFTTRAEANLALFEYIDGFYNSRRIQERLGFLNAEQATAEPTNLNTRQPLLTS